MFADFKCNQNLQIITVCNVKIRGCVSKCSPERGMILRIFLKVVGKTLHRIDGYQVVHGVNGNSEIQINWGLIFRPTFVTGCGSSRVNLP